MIKIDKAGGAVFTIKIAMPAWSSLNVRCPMVIGAATRFKQALYHRLTRPNKDPRDIDTVSKEA